MKTYQVFVSATIQEDRAYLIEAENEQEAIDKQASGEYSYDVAYTEESSQHVYATHEITGGEE